MTHISTHYINHVVHHTPRAYLLYSWNPSSPFKYIKLLSTIFPIVYISPPCLIYFVTGSLYLLISLPISLISPPHCPLATTRFFFVSIYDSFCFVMVALLFCFLGSTYKGNHMVFVFFLLTYFT